MCGLRTMRRKKRCAPNSLSLSLSLRGGEDETTSACACVSRFFLFYCAILRGAIQVSRRRIFEVVLPFFERALRLLGREEKQTEDENIKRPISLPRRR